MQYRVTTPYGDTEGYPLNGGYHKGIDYAYPADTPVVVNGVQIGLSGSTGYSTGAHLHIGKWINGKDTDPGVGNGLELEGAVVSSTGYDKTNGNYVRITDSSGAQWVYLHLNRIDVRPGQELNGGNEDMIGDAAHLNALTMAYFNRGATQDEIDRYVLKVPYTQVIEEFDRSAEYADKKAADADAYTWKQLATAPGKGVADTSELQDALNWKRAAINDFLPQINKLKTEVGSNAKAEQILNDMQATINKHR